MVIAALVLGPFTLAPGSFITFLITSGLTLMGGHSVGMHRLLIHHAFTAPLWLERLLIWLGTLVGMAGPFGMMRAHDMRDWHQRQPVCPPHPSHRATFLRDAWWQLCCRFDLAYPPAFQIEANRANDPVLRWIEATWMWQQLPLALLLYALGGWDFVIWGIPMRISVSLIGHWMVGHYAHRQGHQGWVVDGLAVQGYNLPRFGFISFGESWHGNHHAFPHSAKMGVEQGQIDPGFWFVQFLETLGLARNVQLPESEGPREGLRRL